MKSVTSLMPSSTGLSSIHSMLVLGSLIPDNKNNKTTKRLLHKHIYKGPAAAYIKFLDKDWSLTQALFLHFGNAINTFIYGKSAIKNQRKFWVIIVFMKHIINKKVASIDRLCYVVFIFCFIK